MRDPQDDHAGAYWPNPDQTLLLRAAVLPAPQARAAWQALRPRVDLAGLDRASLRLLAWRNFHPDSAAFWHEVTAGAGSTCGQALRDNARAVVGDVEACDFMAGTQDLEEYRRSGLRAVQSTPLR